MMKRFVSSLLILTAFQTSVAVPQLYQDIAHQYGIDDYLFYESLVKRTGYLSQHRELIPWPWTVYVNGQKYQFKNRIEMFNYLIKYQVKDGYDIRFGFADQALEVQSRPLLWQQLDINHMLITAAQQQEFQHNSSGSGVRVYKLTSTPPTTQSTLKPQWEKLIQRVSKETGVDALLLQAMMRQESVGNEQATSHKGAMGLMQLMPDTAKYLGLSPQQYYDPYHNLKGGARYLREQLETFGDLSLALAAYNAGPGAVSKYGNTVPPYAETKQYVQKITQHYAALKQQRGIK